MTYKYWMLDTGYWMLDTGCWLLVAGCGNRASSIKHRVLSLRSFLFIAPLFIFTCMAMAQENSSWISFSDSYAEGSCPSVRLSRSSADGFVVEMEIPGIYLCEKSATSFFETENLEQKNFVDTKNLEQENLRYDLSIDERRLMSVSVPPFDSETTQMVIASASETGKARLPVFRAFIAIPEHAGAIEPEIVESSSCVLGNMHVYPAGSLIERNGRICEEFARDDDFYSSDFLYPPLLARTFGSSHLRDLRLTCLEICPFQYNPARKQLICHWKVRVHIPSGRALADSGILSEMCSKTVLNSPQTKLFETKSLSKKLGGYMDSFPPAQKAPSMRDARKEGHVYFPADLSRSCRADYLIIAPDVFYEHQRVLDLASWRAEYNGFDVAVVNTSDIYRQFGQGDVGIRNFTRHVYDLWTAPNSSDGHIAYVLLVGDVEYVPTHIAECNNAFLRDIKNIATDNWYACVSGEDHLPDIMLGRLSVKDAKELGVVVDKVIQYEKNPYRGEWVKRALLITGTIETDLSKVEYTRNEILLPAGYLVSEVSQLAGGNFQDVIHHINRGHIIVDYSGHGFRNGWEIFKDFHIPRLSNERKLPVIFSMSCNTAAFDAGDDCFAEAMVKAPNGGCVAFFGASRLAQSSDVAFSLSRGMVQNHLFVLGEIAMSTKLLCTLSESDLQLYNLFGDPALSLYAPRTSYYRKPDLAISPADITFDPEETVSNCLVKISAVVHNIGEADAENLVVEFFRDGDTRQLIGRREISYIPQGGTGEVSLWWRASRGKAHNRIRVEVRPADGEEYTHDNQAVKSLWASIDRKGFPLSINAVTSSMINVLSPPTLFDLDGDGYMELIVQGEMTGSSYFCVCAWRYDGTLVQNFPVYIPAGDQYAEVKVGISPAVGDMDSDGYAEIVCTLRTKKVYLLHHDGRIARGYPVQLRAYAASSPVLYDVNGDGEMEIILALTNGEVDVLKVDGTLLDGFPVFVHSNRQYAFVPPAVAVGDVDGDGEPEIVVKFMRLNGYMGEYVLLNHDGSFAEGSPIKTPCANLFPPSLGDMDNDRHAEIILASEERGICAMNHNGTLLSGFPKETEYELTSSPVLGDIDGDGSLEIIATTFNYVYAWHCDGHDVSGFPIQISGKNSYPILADIDGDDRSEIIFVNNGIRAYHHDGSPVDGFPVKGFGNCNSAPSLADVDADGYLEMAVVAGRDKIHLLDDIGIYNPGHIEWGTDLHDAGNTSSYSAKVILPMPEIYLEAKPRYNGIVLSWRKEFDLADTTSYRILRADFSTGPYVTLASLPKDRSSYVDNTAIADVTYWYKIVAENGAGAPVVSNVARACLKLPSQPFLRDVLNFPNPAPSAMSPDSTTFRYYVEEDARINIRIYSITGQLVDEIRHDAAGGDYNETEWDISSIVSGLYIYVIEASGESGQRMNSKGKLAVIK